MGNPSLKKTTDLIDSLALGNNIAHEDIPKVDLYIDQVIEIFERNYEDSKRQTKEKILTKTMINNYAKGKLFFPIDNKKYSKEHIMLINLIYQLKGTLSINDIKKTLKKLNDEVTTNEFDLESFYSRYLALYEKDTVVFKKDLVLKVEEVRVEVAQLDNKNTEELERIGMITSLVNMSNLYRRAAEKLVDEINEERSDE